MTLISKIGSFVKRRLKMTYHKHSNVWRGWLVDGGGGLAAEYTNYLFNHITRIEKSYEEIWKLIQHFLRVPRNFRFWQNILTPTPDSDSWLRLMTPTHDSDSWLLTPDSWLQTPDSWLLTPTPDSDSWLRLLTPRDSNVNNSRNHQDKEQAWRLTPTPTLAPVSNSNFWLWLLTPTPDQWYVNLIFCLCLHTWPYVK